MNRLYLYADESCHTQNSDNGSMSLVTVFCRGIHRKLIADRIRDIMVKHNINSNSELKWTKVSPNNVKMYIEIIDFLFNVASEGYLGIRALYTKDKNEILFDYNEWYHKMYFLLLKKIIDDHSNTYESFHVLIDYKDRSSRVEIPRIGKYLENYTHGWERLITTTANSKEHVLIQVADVIAGSITYFRRGLKTSDAKITLIKHIFNKFDVSYYYTTPLAKTDFNFFIWSAK